MTPLLLIPIALVLVLGIGLIFLCIRKIQPGRAGVITGWGGVRVSFDWMLRFPVLQSYHIVDISVKKLEIQRKGKDGLICKDNSAQTSQLHSTSVSKPARRACARFSRC
ncbi:MAG: hypothetical protein FJ405_06140 [Verrucomicrobia bacterium]|nr:hypothetical protein [Verrucomicrobiota bacterium]